VSGIWNKLRPMHIHKEIMGKARHVRFDELLFVDAMLWFE